MTHRLAIVLLAAVGLVGAAAAPAMAQESETAPPDRMSWSFAGPFGTFDQGQLQRGFKVYREVCSTCHSMNLVTFRSLAEPGGPGFTTGQVSALAAEYKVQDGPNDDGEMFERPGKPFDHFPPPFPNDATARKANGGALPPDFSVLAKARGYERGFPWWLFDIFTQYQEQGVDYIHGILTGYHDAPAGEADKHPGLHYNIHFPGNWIAMPKPLSDGQVEYEDGTPTTVDQYSRDVAAFMMWAAEPHLDARKRMGFTVMVFLIVFAGLLFYTKKKIWSEDLHHA
jgi:ubiquinol-cytochrome c reductase cytochrome b/c1 subunit